MENQARDLTLARRIITFQYLHLGVVEEDGSLHLPSLVADGNLVDPSRAVVAGMPDGP